MIESWVFYKRCLMKGTLVDPLRPPSRRSVRTGAATLSRSADLRQERKRPAAREKRRTAATGRYWKRAVRSDIGAEEIEAKARRFGQRNRTNSTINSQVGRAARPFLQDSSNQSRGRGGSGYLHATQRGPAEGSAGPPRRDYSQLPVVEGEGKPRVGRRAARCPRAARRLTPATTRIPSDRDEVQSKHYRRLIRRRQLPADMTLRERSSDRNRDPAPKLIHKGVLV